MLTLAWRLASRKARQALVHVYIPVQESQHENDANGWLDVQVDASHELALLRHREDGDVVAPGRGGSLEDARRTWGWVLAMYVRYFRDGGYRAETCHRAPSHRVLTFSTFDPKHAIKGETRLKGGKWRLFMVL